ncbi:MAG: class I SAM-dependent methyltransferase, partial [Planctomycetales bacterium]|nr:class I SAM-dependent methyltransferase [Planctomycetales bacterium]
QAATMDAPLAMELITSAAVASAGTIRRVLDVGCGAGNNSLKLRETWGDDFDVDLLDLSEPMLRRAQTRMQAVSGASVRTIQADFREASLPESAYDVVIAAAVLHHLRDDAEWMRAFEKLHAITAPGGSVWITDLVTQETPEVDAIIWQRYATYLDQLGGADYRDRVLAYIDQEDSPRPVTYQLELLRRVGFIRVELLHKNACFAAFGAIKSRP